MLDEVAGQTQLATPREENTRRLCFGGEVVADAADGVALVVVEGEEFESVTQALAIAHDGTHFDGIGREGQGNFQSHNLARLEAAGESGADAVLAHFGGASPAGAEFSRLKHFDLQADVDDKTGKAARELDPARCAQLTDLMLGS